jgi:type IV secretory pathway VirB2 component (pilin)
MKGNTVMNRKKTYLWAALLTAALPLMVSHPALAVASSSEAGVSNTISFLQTLVNILCAVAGPLAAVYLGIGGFQYITSAGNPERLDHSKRTIVHSIIGLVIVIAALVISNGATSIATKAFGG